MLVLKLISFFLGIGIVGATLLSAIETFVLPRSANDPLTRLVFLIVYRLFDLRTKRARSYEERDRVMALYAPIALLALPPVWLILVMLGFSGMFWAVGDYTPAEAMAASGSSLLTLGFIHLDSLAAAALAVSEATLGLILVALLIAYLPTMYAAFSRREAMVNMLEVRAGSPPWAVQMIERFYRLHGLEHLTDQWGEWERWFVDIEESHTSLAALVFFRSPQAHHSWVTAAGAVLDAAALTASTLDLPRDVQAELTLRAGYLALRHIADFFRIAYIHDPKPSDPISISKFEYDDVYARLAKYGVPLKTDREQAWRDFAGWRVNYDTVLLALAALTMAPYAPWSSDRSLMQRTATKLGPPNEVEAVGRA